jgi:hypothetical protein
LAAAAAALQQRGVSGGGGSNGGSGGSLGCTLLFALLLRLGPKLQSNISITRNTE